MPTSKFRLIPSPKKLQINIAFNFPYIKGILSDIAILLEKHNAPRFASIDCKINQYILIKISNSKCTFYESLIKTILYFRTQ